MSDDGTVRDAFVPAACACSIALGDHRQSARLKIRALGDRYKVRSVISKSLTEWIFDCVPNLLGYVSEGLMKTPLTIGEYLIQRLYAHGVRHVFGIPGDYVLVFYDQLAKSKLRTIN